mmetsp:Transcript_18407/g.28238  ORF Transcript_18407/g.28238 Transcript_18407/m.28238 type:complete len:191 (+) Transcript_18407:1727-2299(+)
MAAEPLRVIAMAYFDMSIDEWESKFEHPGMNPDQLFDKALDSRALTLTFIGMFGLKDPIRTTVPSCVHYARDFGQINVRMISGDHIETAKAVANRAGILRKEDEAKEYSVLLASEFRELCGNVLQKSNYDDESLEFEIENMEEFEKIARDLRVLARATAKDKHMLVVGLKKLGRQISVTGDGINDVEALR